MHYAVSLCIMLYHYSTMLYCKWLEAWQKWKYFALSVIYHTTPHKLFMFEWQDERSMLTGRNTVNSSCFSSAIFSSLPSQVLVLQFEKFMCSKKLKVTDDWCVCRQRVVMEAEADAEAIQVCCPSHVSFFFFSSFFSFFSSSSFSFLLLSEMVVIWVTGVSCPIESCSFLKHVSSAHLSSVWLYWLLWDIMDRCRIWYINENIGRQTMN